MAYDYVSNHYEFDGYKSNFCLIAGVWFYFIWIDYNLWKIYLEKNNEFLWRF